MEKFRKNERHQYKGSKRLPDDCIGIIMSYNGDSSTLSNVLRTSSDLWYYINNINPSCCKNVVFEYKNPEVFQTNAKGEQEKNNNCNKQKKKKNKHVGVINRKLNYVYCIKIHSPSKKFDLSVFSNLREISIKELYYYKFSSRRTGSESRSPIVTIMKNATNGLFGLSDSVEKNLSQLKKIKTLKRIVVCECNHIIDKEYKMIPKWVEKLVVRDVEVFTGKNINHLKNLKHLEITNCPNFQYQSIRGFNKIKVIYFLKSAINDLSVSVFDGFVDLEKLIMTTIEYQPQKLDFDCRCLFRKSKMKVLKVDGFKGFFDVNIKNDYDSLFLNSLRELFIFEELKKHMFRELVNIKEMRCINAGDKELSLMPNKEILESLVIEEGKNISRTTLRNFKGLKKLVIINCQTIDIYGLHGLKKLKTFDIEKSNEDGLGIILDEKSSYGLKNCRKIAFRAGVYVPLKFIRKFENVEMLIIGQKIRYKDSFFFIDLKKRFGNLQTIAIWLKEDFEGKMMNFLKKIHPFFDKFKMEMNKIGVKCLCFWEKVFPTIEDEIIVEKKKKQTFFFS